MFGALFERKSATIKAAKSREPEYFTVAPVAFSKQLTVFSNIFSSWPSIEPATVMTSPSKLPKSPSLDGVSQTSACAAPTNVNEAATSALAPNIFLVICIYFLPEIVLELIKTSGLKT